MNLIIKAAILRVKNEESGNMDVRFYSYAAGVTEKENNDPRRSNQGFVGLVTESRKPQIVERISKSGTVDKFISSDWIKKNGFESFGCFPLIVPQREEVVGTLSLFAGHEYEFHSSCVDFLNNVISSISLLVQKEKKREKIEKKFSILVQQWQNETGFMSSTSEAVIHPAYQRIIGMGEEAIPLLLKELTKASGRWFWALKSITGEDPVPKDQRGKTQLMIKAWIDWGKEKGYISESESIKNH
jgi:transcriptional regulator with GAF, ATPase, and Fis domain